MQFTSERQGGMGRKSPPRPRPCNARMSREDGPKGDAGIGRPGASGWEWTVAREIGPRIEQVVEVLQNKAKPQFVSLPVKVQ